MNWSGDSCLLGKCHGIYAPRDWAGDRPPQAPGDGELGPPLALRISSCELEKGAPVGGHIIAKVGPLSPHTHPPIKWEALLASPEG